MFKELFMVRIGKLFAICFTSGLLLATNATIDSSNILENAIQEEDIVETKQEMSFSGGVAAVLEGKSANITSSEIDEENGLMIVKEVTQEGEIISEIHIDTETKETTIVTTINEEEKEENKNLQETNDLNIINDIIQIIIETYGEDNLIFYEEALEMVPLELRIPSDGTFISAFGPSEKQVRLATEDEIVLLGKTIQAEARDEPFEGKVVVAASVLNRRDKNGGTIKDIITSPRQYASITSINEVKPECLEAAIAAVNGYDPSRIIFPDGLIYFNQPGAANDRHNVVLKLRIGGHDCAREYGK